MLSSSYVQERHAYRGSNAVPSLLEAVQSWADRLPSRDAEPQKPLSADLRALVESAISSSIPLPTMPERPIRRLQTSMASRPAPASESLAAESIKKGLPAREGPAECNGSCVAGSPSTQESGQGKETNQSSAVSDPCSVAGLNMLLSSPACMYSIISYSMASLVGSQDIKCCKQRLEFP